MVQPYQQIDPDTGEYYGTGATGGPGDSSAAGTGYPTSGPITDFYAKFSRYPGNNKQWWVAKADSDDPDATPPVVAGQFLPDELNKFWAGNNLAPRGHYVLQAFYKDRTGTSGIQNIPVEVTNERPTAVAFFSGRAWFGCNSTVYYSQIMNDRSKAGLCYQVADPTSEQISDLIASDGGVLPIPEAGKIVKLLATGGSILVFAINGVWAVTGGQSGFSATDMSISKISPIGCSSPGSIVESDSDIYWWSEAGIMAVTQNGGSFGPLAAYNKENISQGTIQTFYNNISESAKMECKGIYDLQNNIVMWMYRDDDVGPKQYNRILHFDTGLKAFYPWKTSVETVGDQHVMKGFFTSINKEVSDNDPDRDYYIRYVSMIGPVMSFSQFSSTTFTDWGALPYDSYMETGYELFDDAMRKKNITYVFSYLRRTETSADVNGIPDRPSSCYMQVKFDWASGAQSNKWTTPVQVYRNNRLTFDPDTGFAVVIAKDKVRGSGKSIQFRYGTSDPGCDFDLHGWSIEVSGNTNP